MSIDNTDDIIDSRDIIDRIEELRQMRSDMLEGARETGCAKGTWETTEAAGELRALVALAKEILWTKEAEPESSDWKHGETLIRRSYFVDYISDLIHDCYEMPKEMHSGAWPYRHMTIDYQEAAKEAEQDYASVDFDGVEYLIRSC